MKTGGAMGNLIAAIPPFLRTSTTGMGIAGFAAATAASVAMQYTQNLLYIQLAGIIAAAITLILFPQATGAPVMAVELANDIRPAIAAVAETIERAAAAKAPAPGTETTTATTVTAKTEKTPL